MKDITIYLREPLKANGTVLTELTMRMPFVKDKLAAQKLAKDDADSEVNLMAILTGLAPDDMPSMPLPDYVQLTEAYNSFFPPSPKSSDKP